MEALRGSGQGFLVPEERAVHGVGHSNGALLHALIGAMFAPANASNALISFNNKCAHAALFPAHSFASCQGLGKPEKGMTAPWLIQNQVSAKAGPRMLRYSGR